MGLLRFLLALALAGGYIAGMFGFSADWILPGNRAPARFFIWFPASDGNDPER
jgi:hypothetical protein